MEGACDLDPGGHEAEYEQCHFADKLQGLLAFIFLIC